MRLGEYDIRTEIDCSPDDAEYCNFKPVDNSVVESIVYHDYREKSLNQHFDIALLRLASKVQYNEFIQPICLPLDPSLWTKDYDGHTLEVTGWTSNLFEKLSFQYSYFSGWGEFWFSFLKIVFHD